MKFPYFKNKGPGDVIFLSADTYQCLLLIISWWFGPGFAIILTGLTFPPRSHQYHFSPVELEHCLPKHLVLLCLRDVTFHHWRRSHSSSHCSWGLSGILQFMEISHEDNNIQSKSKIQREVHFYLFFKICLIFLSFLISIWKWAHVHSGSLVVLLLDTISH